jgi:pullulanase
MLKKLAVFCAFAFCALPSFAQIPAGDIRIHYSRPDGNYSGWTIYAFENTTENTGNYGGGPVAVTGIDSYGAYFDVGVTSGANSVGIIIHNPTHAGGDLKDPGPNEFVDPATQGNEYWAVSGVDALYTTQPVPANEPALLLPGYARIHYYRPDGNYANWSVYSFNDTEEPTSNFNDGPVFQTGSDFYGAFFDIKLTANPNDLGFIVHNPSTGVKDPGPDMHLAVNTFKEAWVISGDSTVYTSLPSAGQILSSGFSRLQAFWIDRATVAVPSQNIQSGWTLSLVYSPTANLQITSTFGLTGGTSIPLTLLASGLTAAQLQQYPQLAGYAVYKLPATVAVNTLKQSLKGQLAVAAADSSGALKYLTGVQIAGVLDDLFYYGGSLGAIFPNHGMISVNVWAPTAQWMKLQLFHNPTDTTPASVLPMAETNGVWSVQIDPSWTNHYYLLDTMVYVPSLHQIVENVVTDPYSVDLALNGVKTRLTNLSSDTEKPGGWDESGSPWLNSLNDLTIYEMHVRDFSGKDASVPAQYRGTYLAFTDPGTNGMRHLRDLANAGMKAIHILPTFHIASINEDKTAWQTTPNLSGYPPDSEEQQAAVTAIQNNDAYNWGYDPVHYLAPEGAYAYNPDKRVKEYREMVQGIHRAGLRVVQDVVFNHTDASGQSANSVLDKLVPAYYYRLDADGNVENGSCCSDTASEHRMMEKLMIDTVVTNARQYKIDGYRFDLMSFHFVYNMLHIQSALSALTLERDGVDGSKIYLYGEGWTTGETANDALGPNASQANLYGTGIGTFNDRIRDGVRGGGPFSDQRVQGFATGLYTDPSLYTTQNTSAADQLSALLQSADWVRAGLAGNMRDFTFTDSAGQTVAANQLIYGGQPVGYTASPIENVAYASVHDNQTLFDAVQLKSAIPGTITPGTADTIAQRTRRQIVANSLIALAQGVPFFQAGDDLLRSKDMDNNSYNSGDWFNDIDFTFRTNNWGTGLPIASENQSNWPFMQPLLANAALKPTPANIDLSRQVFQDFLSIRASSSLFRMSTLAQVQASLHFLNTGPHQIPGVIVMALNGAAGQCGQYSEVLVVFNATTAAVNFQDNSLKGLRLQLHPLQARSADATVRQATFNGSTGTAGVPALTTAVFVSNGGR